MSNTRGSASRWPRASKAEAITNHARAIKSQAVTREALSVPNAVACARQPPQRKPRHAWGFSGYPAPRGALGDAQRAGHFAGVRVADFADQLGKAGRVSREAIQHAQAIGTGRSDCIRKMKESRRAMRTRARQCAIRSPALGSA